MIPTLTTARLTLRGPLPGDADPLGRFLVGARSVWIGGPWPAEDAPDWLDYQTEVWNQHGWGCWIVELRETRVPIGRVGFLKHDGVDEPELAWMLFDGYERQGLAFEAVQAALAHGRDVLGLTQPCSFVDADNLRSKRLAERLGARRDGKIALDGMTFDLWRHLVPDTQGAGMEAYA